MITMHKNLLALALILAACAPRPARFADAPPVLDVHDDAPIPMPRAFEPVPEWRMSEAYLRRPLVNALDPARVPEAADVNALDDVPRSSWLAAPGGAIEADAIDPPAPPLHPVAAAATTRAGALRVVDARGRFYEVWRDPPDRPEMSTGAAAVASRLLRAIGYRVPGTWAIDLTRADFSTPEAADRAAVRALLAAGPPASDGRYRVGLVRWPIGVDLGPTHPFDRRVGDGNDRVPHLDRRTLRSLRAAFAWLSVDRLGAGLLRDAYVGAPGSGHVAHWIVYLGGALGADAVVRTEKPREDDADLVGRNAWITLATLGVYAPKVQPTQTRWPALGEIGPALGAAPFQTSPPFEPFDRMRAGDAYWMAKRVAALPPDVFADALAAGRYSDPEARARLAGILSARRNALLALAFSAVTPLDVEGVAGDSVTLRDEAAARGFAIAATTRYEVTILDERGTAVNALRAAAPREPRFAVVLPRETPAYAILRITAVRDGRAAPRPMEVHVVRRARGWAIVGVRH